MTDSAPEPHYTTPPFSLRAHDMPRSAIRRIFENARRLQESGADVVRLDIGDPDFDTPQRVRDGITAALSAGKTHYSPMAGIPELRSAIAGYMARRWGVDCGPQRITCHQGATQSLNAVIQLCCDIGAGILLPEIYFPNYIQQVTLGGLKAKFYELDERFIPRLSDLEALIDPSTRAILINTPSNPTGALFPEETVRALYDFAARHNLWIISDEAYCEFVFEGRYVSPLQIDWEQPEAQRRVIAIYSFSKGFACTGLRMGWSVSPSEEIANQLMVMNEPFTGSLTTPLQYGLVHAFDEDDTPARIEALRPRWQLAGDELKAAGLPFDPPEGGIFFFVDISSLRSSDGAPMSSLEFCDRALNEAHVAIVPGAGFGLQPSYDASGRPSFAPGAHAASGFRLCFAVPEQRLRLGVERLRAFIASL